MIIDQTFSKEIALDLLDINAVILRPNDPFTWSSGWNSPIYCDNRLTMRYPKIRKKIAKNFVEFIAKEYPNTDVITGTATAGIPHAAWVAENMDKPLSYVRAKAKAYGLGNQIEGGIQKGETTVVVEDLISTGGSAISVVEALQFIGAEIEAVLSIFTYGFDKANKRFDKAGVPIFTLTDYTTLIDVASENDYVNKSDLETLAEWRKTPDTWPN
ncbi:orotate phosphoribosyltransferase [Aliifodinibius salipaludis]|uniref:Orotate phosphoribosyltransferase n=1 Tax=Fodinibius salipaludis TaxID=2032627 RepID=A0A2A2GDJ1_9BACT|nr:orotate phosphoribosyltransferase [Aliifodinibius salipaludis]PAU95611.1 orotate phosphoribosyltransferase [Aliifodinibius salipaludis]